MRTITSLPTNCKSKPNGHPLIYLRGLTNLIATGARPEVIEKAADDLILAYELNWKQKDPQSTRALMLTKNLNNGG